jgi:hypothetical protein
MTSPTSWIANSSVTTVREISVFQPVPEGQQPDYVPRPFLASSTFLVEKMVFWADESLLGL